jgi:glycosyltransferase involved in cell wall biosynthesis
VQRIGVDATSVSPAGKGISRVQAKTVEILAQPSSPYEVVAYVCDSAACELLTPSGARCVEMKRRLALVWEQVVMPRRFARDRLAALVTTTERLPLWGRGRYIVWLFEIPTHRIEQNRQERAGLYQRLSDSVTLALWKRSLRRAACVVAASHATAAELREALENPASGIPVIYPGLDGFSPGTASRNSPYLFHLASSDPRDNSETVLGAYAIVKGRLSAPPPLVVAGGLGARTEFLRREIDRLGLGGHVELLGRVSDDQLLDLYRGAAAYVDASLFEGFGYQVLEAMACGAPVVASRVTSIPELVGDAGLLCDPRSSGEFADALLHVLDPQVADDLRRRGPARAGEFTWAATARALHAVLADVLAPDA